MNMVHDGIDKEGLAFSKGIVIFGLVQFMFTGFIVVTLATSIVDGSKTQETAQAMSYLSSALSWISGVLASVVTVSGTLAITSVVWYLKKTHLSYATKVQGDVGARLASVEVGYNRACYRLKKEFNLSDIEFDRLIDMSQAKRMKESLFTDVTNTARIGVSEGSETIRKEG